VAGEQPCRKGAGGAGLQQAWQPGGQRRPGVHPAYHNQLGKRGDDRCRSFQLNSYSILFYSILFYSILFYSILFYSILFYSILLLATSFPCQYMLRKSFTPFVPSPALAEGVEWVIMSHARHWLSLCGVEACTFWWGRAADHLEII